MVASLVHVLFAVLFPLLVSAGFDAPIPPVGREICLDESSTPAVSARINEVAARSALQESSDKKNLPVFFFHGLTASSEEGANLKANITAEGRAFVALSFCEKECSLQALSLQVPMAIASIREVVASDEQFENGYIFIGHSMGGLLARAVIEEMDDHKVHTYVSLAGGLTGMFYGPQEADHVPAQALAKGFGSKTISPGIFDFANYASDDYRGKMQYDWARTLIDPTLQAKYAITNLARVPVREVWLTTNQFMPKFDNVIRCAWFDFHCNLEKIRRKSNFLRVKEAHLFASPEDGIAAPWQMGIFGQYSDVAALEDVESAFEDLTIVQMRDTTVYKEDTFGLRTLDDRGGLFLHTVEGVSHACWLFDFPNFYSEGTCEFAHVYDKHVYKVIS